MSTNADYHEVTNDEELDKLVEIALRDAGTERAELRRRTAESLLASPIAEIT